MHRFISRIVSVLLFLCGQTLIAAIPSVDQTSPRVSNVALLFPTQIVRPGSDLQGIVEFFLDPGWHMYWKNPGEVGTAPTFDWELPSGITLKGISWPTPSRLRSGETFFYGYEGTPKWVVTLSVDPKMSPGTYPLTLSAFWLLCDGTCVPASQRFETSITVSPTAPLSPPSEIVTKAQSLLPINIPEGSVRIDHDRLFVRLPIHEMDEVRTIVLFPEQGGLFTPEQLPQWEWNDGVLELSIHSPADVQGVLTKAGRFSGLCQLVSSSKIITYSFDILSSSIFSQESQGEQTPASPSEETFPIALFLAVVGGLLLNFTPCVLPVIGLKVLTLLSLREAKALKIIPHGLVYTLGVLATFWVLAGTLYLFESFGTTMGWGFQLQDPRFVMALAVLLLFLSLNLFGLFEVGTSVAAWASEVEYQKGLSARAPTLLASFVSGVLATLVATPCTGPLLGSLFGFASTFRPTEGLLLFSAVGLGMSLPLLIITAIPPFIRLLPRPGPWMVGLKQFFGFCALTTMVWLLWVLSEEVPSLPYVTVLSGFLLVAFGLWILGRWGTPVRPRGTRVVCRLFSLFFIAGGGLVLASSIDQYVAQWIHTTIPERPGIQWHPYSKSLLDSEVRKGNTVFVAFSARWCLTCQTNKLSFLSEKAVDVFAKHHIVALEADWTNGDPEITAELRSLKRNGVPVYAIFKKGCPPTLLPELVTPDIIVQAIEASQ